MHIIYQYLFGIGLGLMIGTGLIIAIPIETSVIPPDISRVIFIMSIPFLLMVWLDYIFNAKEHEKQPSQKLCKHEWEYIDENWGYENAGAGVDVYRIKTYQCKHCLEVKKERKY